MANQYSKLTAENIMRKVNRKKNPVTSIAQLAREFGIRTNNRWTLSTSAPPSFRRQVIALVGVKTYKQIRESRTLNRAHR